MGLRTRLRLKKRPAPGAGKLSFRTANPWLPTPTGIKRISGGWYRGESTNYSPTKKLLRSADGAVRYIIAGWEPTQPLISRSTAVTVFGSCFAVHIANWLHERQYSISTKQSGGRSFLIDHGDGFVNSISVRTQFEWALEKRFPPRRVLAWARCQGVPLRRGCAPGNGSNYPQHRHVHHHARPLGDLV